MKKIQILVCLGLLIASFILSGCQKQKPTPAPSPSPAAKLIQIPQKQRPYISLIPRSDGHELKLIIDNIPQNINQIEYELIYTVNDQNIQMEKGVGDTVKIESVRLEKDLLLGTASCTTTCKYKYDEGVTGGNLSLTLITSDNQMSTFKTNFALASSDDINQNQKLSLPDQITINAIAQKGQYFVILQNYGLPQPSTVASTVYSVFSSGNGAGQINSITPETITKENLKSLEGDYLVP